MATTIGSWASSMPVPASETNPCPRDQWPNQVDSHIHVGPPRLELRQLMPLGETEVHTPLTEVHTPLAEVEKLPLIEAGSRPPQPEAENQLPQGALLNCPPGQREVVMAGRGIKGQSKNLTGYQRTQEPSIPDWAITGQAGVSWPDLQICSQ